MFFAASKLFDVLASPLTWGLLLTTVGIWCARPLPFRRHPPTAREARLAVLAPLCAVILVYTFSTAPVANALIRGLEASAVRTERPYETYDAVVLLGGMVDAEATESTDQVSYMDTVERLLAAYERLRTGRAHAIVISGGTGNRNVRQAVEAHVLAAQLEAWGIAPERIVREDQSRNTRENAVETARIVRERGYQKLLLITSAFHVARALGCFRAVGLEPDVLPVDYRGYEPSRFSGSLLPRAGALADSTLALREYVGRIAYRVRGYATD